MGAPTAKSPKDHRYEYVVKAPDGGYGWVVLVSCFFISFIVDGSMYSIGIILPHIKQNFDAEQEQVNLISGLYTGFLFCSGPIVSGLSNQFGIRPVVMGGAIVTSATFLATAFAPNLIFIQVVYGVIGGVASGCVYIASLIIIADYFDRLKGISTGITMAGSGVGSFVFAPLVQGLIRSFDWKFTLIIVSCIMFQCCVLGALLRPIQPTRQLKKEYELKALGEKEQEQQATSSDVHTRDVAAFTGSAFSIQSNRSQKGKLGCGQIALNIAKETFNLKLLVQNKSFLFVTLSQFVVFTGYFLPFIYIPLRAEELGITQYSWIFSVIGIVNIPSRLAFGFLADRRYLAPINLNTLATGMSAIIVLIYFSFTTFGTQIFFAVIFAISIGAMNCLCTPYLSDIVGKEKFSNAMGIINLFRGIGCFIGAPVGGVLSKKYNNSLAAFWFTGGCLAAGFVFTALVSLATIVKFIQNRRKRDNNNNSNEREGDARDAEELKHLQKS